MILLHEVGHQVVAQRLRCTVYRIDLFPLHGHCVHEMPFTEEEHAKIAWGGVLGQFIVAVPMIITVLLFGYTRVQAINAVLAILGFFSFAVAVINLLPIKPLDGSIAWRIAPYLWVRIKRRMKRPRTERDLRAVK